MKTVKNSSLWINAGYDLFAREGLECIQVERLARMLNRNKSGFYHYFGDIDGFHMEILKLHEENINEFLHEVSLIKKLDPQYLELLIKHAGTVMFQVQLVRTKTSVLFYRTSEEVDKRLNIAVQALWTDFLGVKSNNDLAMRYYYLVRDTLYRRIGFENLNYRFLADFVHEAKEVVDQLVRRRSLQTVHAKYQGFPTARHGKV